MELEHWSELPAGSFVAVGVSQQGDEPAQGSSTSESRCEAPHNGEAGKQDELDPGNSKQRSTKDVVEGRTFEDGLRSSKKETIERGDVEAVEKECGRAERQQPGSEGEALAPHQFGRQQQGFVAEDGEAFLKG